MVMFKSFAKLEEEISLEEDPSSTRLESTGLMMGKVHEEQGRSVMVVCDSLINTSR
jgi:hypothetical protein